MKRISIILLSVLVLSCSNKKQESSLESKDSTLIDRKKKKEAVYSSIKIGNQEWMDKNLDVESYQNGEPIPEVLTWSEWESYAHNKTGCFCRGIGTLKKDYAKTYGNLYNWYAVNDQRGFAPKGWHVPNENEWNSLIQYLGGKIEAANKIKTTIGWDVNSNGNNSSKFGAKPGGVLRAFSNQYFIGENKNGMWWSTTEIDNKMHEMTDHEKQVWAFSVYLQAPIELIEENKYNGLSVRCISDMSSKIEETPIDTTLK